MNDHTKSEQCPSDDGGREPESYEPPQVIGLGSFKELTSGDAVDPAPDNTFDSEF